jgi:MoxR-like ATPase
MLPEETIQDAQQQIGAVMSEVQKMVIGQSRLVRNLVIALLAKGHILLEWVPGLAKTLSIETLSKALGVQFSRIQFTPDLLPSDLLGTRVFDPATVDFVTRKGPIFANLVLADEINRAPAKVQSALLEAMAERQVTIGEEKFVLDAPFVVMATQNPLEQEGTYSLPEAQLDRFLLKTVITYPTPEEEIHIMQQMGKSDLPAIGKMMSKKHILELQALVEQIYVSDALYQYVKNIVFATRFPEQYGLDELCAYIDRGVSPRASLALIQCAKVLALMAWRPHVLPEDIKEIAHEVMRHRLVLSFEALAADMQADEIITKILQTVPLVEEV